MSLRTHPALLYARARGGGALVLSLVLVPVLTVLAPTGYTDVPVRDLAAVWVPALVPIVPGLFLGAALANPNLALETVAPRDPRMLRAVWVLAVVVVSSFVVGLSLGGGLELTALMVRNCLFALGLTAAAAIVLPAAISWGPLGAYAVAVFQYGTIDQSATPRWWALFQQPPGTTAALLVAVGVAILGCSLWAWNGSRAPLNTMPE